MLRHTVIAAALLALAWSSLPPLSAEDETTDGPAPPEVPTLPAPRLVGPRLDEARTKALQKGGGNAATERAVTAGLDWLARHVGEDGGWDADGFADQCAEGTACTGIGKGQHGEDMPCPFDDAITAVATLAFLGRGHLPGADDDPHGALVEAALERLRGAGGTWGLALATQCFAEAEALERKGRWQDDAESGARALLGRRQADGAWGYAAPYRPGSDIPFTALAVQALVTARDAGVELPADLAPGVEKFLATLEVKKGRLAYMKEGRRYGYTPTSSNAHCGAAIRHLLGVGLSTPAHRANMSLIAKQKPSWKISFRDVNVPGRGKVPVQIGNLSMYQWWYGTVATFQAGGTSWSGWYGKAKSALVGHQEKRGCATGSWDPKGTYERQTGGRVFATALGVLILEQPYRHRRIER